MDDVGTVRRRTHIWPVVIALIILAVVIAFALFAMKGGPLPDQGRNGQTQPALTVLRIYELTNAQC